MRAICLLAVCACSTPAARRAVPPPPTEAPRADFVVREVSVRHDGAVLSSDAKLHSRDRFDIVIDLTGKAFVYVVRISPTKGLSVLYPMTTSGPLAAGPTRLPVDPRQIFQLDDEVGDEHVYIIAMDKAMRDGAPAVADAVKTLEATFELAAPTVPVDTLPTVDVPDAGVQVTPTVDAAAPIAKQPAPKRKPRKPQAGGGGSAKPAASSMGSLDDMERDVVVVSLDGTVTCSQVTPNEQGVAACRFTIRHLK
jgi:hypothetical protein